MATFLTTFEPTILIFHYIISVLLVGVILLQAGKGTDIGAAFGAGGSQSLFGTSGASTVLTKITTGLALAFLATSLALSSAAKYTSTGAGESIIQEELEKATGETVAPNLEVDKTATPKQEAQGAKEAEKK